MWRRKRHVSDGDLLLLEEDGTLSRRRRSAVRRHVAGCPRCAARRVELGAALAEVSTGCRETPAAMSALHVARARLRIAIEALPPSGSFAGWPAWTGVAIAAAVVVVVAMLSWPAVDRGAAPGRPGAGSPAPAGAGGQASTGLERPRQDLTPGSVLPVGVDDVCVTGVTGVPSVAAQVPRQVFEAYGVDYRRAAEYELDFLITPELGGASDPRNLWPQPYRAGLWNAYVKDELERELQDLVCRGTLDPRDRPAGAGRRLDRRLQAAVQDRAPAARLRPVPADAGRRRGDSVRARRTASPAARRAGRGGRAALRGAGFARRRDPRTAGGGRVSAGPEPPRGSVFSGAVRLATLAERAAGPLRMVRAAQDPCRRDRLPRVPRAVLGGMEDEAQRRTRQACSTHLPWNQQLLVRGGSQLFQRALDRRVRACRRLIERLGGAAGLAFGAQGGLLGLGQHLAPRISQQAIESARQVAHVKPDRSRAARPPPHVLGPARTRPDPRRPRALASERARLA